MGEAEIIACSVDEVRWNILETLQEDLRSGRTEAADFSDSALPLLFDSSVLLRLMGGMNAGDSATSFISSADAYGIPGNCLTIDERWDTELSEAVAGLDLVRFCWRRYSSLSILTARSLPPIAVSIHASKST